MEILGIQTERYVNTINRNLSLAGVDESVKGKQFDVREKTEQLKQCTSLEVQPTALRNELLEPQNDVIYTLKNGDVITAEMTDDVQVVKINIQETSGNNYSENIQIDKINPEEMSFKELMAFSAWLKDRMDKDEIKKDPSTIRGWRAYENAGKEYVFDVSEVTLPTNSIDEKYDFLSYFQKQYNDAYHFGDMPRFFQNIQMHHALCGQVLKTEGRWKEVFGNEDLVIFGDCTNDYQYPILNQRTHNVDIFASWSPESTKENPIMLLTRYDGGMRQETHEIAINEVDPSNASYMEIHAVYVYDATIVRGSSNLDFLNKIIAKNYTYDELNQKKDWYKEIRDTCETIGSGKQGAEKQYYLNGAITNMYYSFYSIHNSSLPEWPTVPCIRFQMQLAGRVDEDYRNREVDGNNFKIQDVDGYTFRVYDKRTGAENVFSYSWANVAVDNTTGRCYLYEEDEDENVTWMEGKELQTLLKEYFQFDELKAGELPDDIRKKMAGGNLEFQNGKVQEHHLKEMVRFSNLILEKDLFSIVENMDNEKEITFTLQNPKTPFI